MKSNINKKPEKNGTMHKGKLLTRWMRTHARMPVYVLHMY